MVQTGKQIYIFIFLNRQIWLNWHVEVATLTCCVTIGWLLKTALNNQWFLGWLFKVYDNNFKTSNGFDM
jgi:hypothetical protein